MIYLFKISFRGIFGYNDAGKQERYKFDAIEYYQFDLDWFAFIFIFLALDCMAIYWTSYGILYDEEDQLGRNQTTLVCLSVAKFLQLFIMSDIRDGHKNVI